MKMTMMTMNIDMNMNMNKIALKDEESNLSKQIWTDWLYVLKHSKGYILFLTGLLVIPLGIIDLFCRVCNPLTDIYLRLSSRKPDTNQSKPDTNHLCKKPPINYSVITCPKCWDIAVFSPRTFSYECRGCNTSISKKEILLCRSQIHSSI